MNLSRNDTKAAQIQLLPCTRPVQYLFTLQGRLQRGKATKTTPKPDAKTSYPASYAAVFLSP